MPPEQTISPLYAFALVQSLQSYHSERWYSIQEARTVVRNFATMTKGWLEIFYCIQIIGLSCKTYGFLVYG